MSVVLKIAAVAGGDRVAVVEGRSMRSVEFPSDVEVEPTALSYAICYIAPMQQLKSLKNKCIYIEYFGISSKLNFKYLLFSRFIGSSNVYRLSASKISPYTNYAFRSMCKINIISIRQMVMA